jgi:6-phosphofructokinase 1
VVDNAMKKLLLLTSGGDCPGLNGVIRAIVKAAAHDGNWQVYGSRRAYCGVLETPHDIIHLSDDVVAGIHVRGGTILETVNKGNPIAFPTDIKGKRVLVDRSNELINVISELGFDAVINIGGDGSHKVSQHLYERGLNIIGVPKTIDNDLFGTDYTIGFQTAVDTATEAIDRLIPTAQSHNRVIITEVMGRDAGWICLHSAIAAGAEVALLPEIPYCIDTIINKLQTRFDNGHGFANIVISEGAKPIEGEVVSHQSTEFGYENPVLGGIAEQLAMRIKAQLPLDVRVTVLGHIQRGGTPNAFDRVLGAEYGVLAFELVKQGKFGLIPVHKNGEIKPISLKEATSQYRAIPLEHVLIKTARSMGICLGDT